MSLHASTAQLDTSKGALREAERLEVLAALSPPGDPARKFFMREVDWWVSYAASLEEDGL